MKPSLGNLLTLSTQNWPLVHPPVSGNGSWRRPRRLWLAAAMALALAAVLLSVACGGGEENEPLKLVPEGATLIAEIEVADILEKVDLDLLLDALPDEGDAPQTVDEALDLIVSVTGIDLRDITRAIIFGDLQREDNYVGLIVRGVIDEEGLSAAIQRASGAPLSTETYKGRELHVFGDEPDGFVTYTLLETRLKSPAVTGWRGG